ncbi:hypothetical protein KAZ66_04735 [Candidatus Woesebacteria bacterium]|nr:hypothetical protein [Candidatus Woesebacteria bacterium]
MNIRKVLATLFIVALLWCSIEQAQAQQTSVSAMLYLPIVAAAGTPVSPIATPIPTATVTRTPILIPTATPVLVPTLTPTATPWIQVGPGTACKTVECNVIVSSWITCIRPQVNSDISLFQDNAFSSYPGGVWLLAVQRGLGLELTLTQEQKVRHQQLKALPSDYELYVRCN